MVGGQELSHVGRVTFDLGHPGHGRLKTSLVFGVRFTGHGDLEMTGLDVRLIEACSKTSD